MLYGVSQLGSVSMEDERLKDLLTRVTNFDWTEPFDWDEAFCAAHPKYAHVLAAYHSLTADSPPDAERDEYRERFREFRRAPSAAHDAYDGYRKRLWEFRRSLRRDFPEWHFSDGSRVGQFVGKEGSHSIKPDPRLAVLDRSIQRELREVWNLASTKQPEKAKRKLWRMSEHFMRDAERMLETVGTRSTREKPEGEAYQLEAKPQSAAVLSQMAKTLDWLQTRLGRLKICENPKCHGRKYFFKVYNNDRYCCPKCVARAKALRDAKRTPKKEPTKSEETRYKMKIAAEERWAKRKRDERRKGSTPPKKPQDDAGGLSAGS